MRGLLLIKNFLDYTIGITPTCAGTTWYQVQGLPLLWDHPCMCGDYPGNATYKICSRGSPLHVRGLHVSQSLFLQPVRITPACAGTTYNPVAISFTNRDHPRLCGDYESQTSTPLTPPGSPPPVRGLLKNCNAFYLLDGITPACAGTTQACSSMLQFP